jgi:hypothetical protein
MGLDAGNSRILKTRIREKDEPNNSSAWTQCEAREGIMVMIRRLSSSQFVGCNPSRIYGKRTS